MSDITTMYNKLLIENASLKERLNKAADYTTIAINDAATYARPPSLEDLTTWLDYLITMLKDK